MEGLQGGASALHAPSECHYSIFLHLDQHQSTSLPARDDLFANIISYLASLSLDHVYHRHSLNLARIATDLPATLLLQGSTDVTDAVDDEWYIVHLLRALTLQFQTAVVQIHDEDGQFLLIEAAEELPKWVTPDNADNRVFIHKGELHLIPLSSSNDIPLALTTALDLIHTRPAETVASANLQSLAFARLPPPTSPPPISLHSLTLPLPLSLAQALSENAALIPDALNAFYNRDSNSLLPLTKMAKFPPPKVEDCVQQRIGLPRSLFAVLSLQKFYPPKKFLSEGWTGGRKEELAVKLICAFEMHYAQTRPRPRQTPTPPPTTFSSTPSLREVDFWERTTLLPTSQRPFWQRVDEAIEASTSSSSSALIGNPQNLPDDTEDWLTTDVDGLDALLEKRGVGLDDEDLFDSDEDEETEERRAKKAAKRLREMVGKVEGFVEGEGDLEGAMFEDEKSDDDDDAEDSDDDDEDGLNDDLEDIDKEEDAEAIAKAKATFLETLVPSVPITEWGRKPDAPASTSPNPSAAGVSTSKPATAGALPDLKKPFASHSRHGPILTEETYDGASDSEGSDDGEVDSDADAEGEEPAVVGDEDGEEGMEAEMEAFLEFATGELGLSKEQFESILGERRTRGAYVPEAKTAKPTPTATSKAAPKRPAAPPTKSAPPPPKPTAKSRMEEFDELMQKMEKELGRGMKAPRDARAEAMAKPKVAPSSFTQSAPATSTTTPAKSGGSDKRAGASIEEVLEAEEGDVQMGEVEDDDDLDEAEEAAMMAELREHLGPMEGSDYDLVKNFLESGMDGPAGGLAGRLGFKLPRNVGGSGDDE